ncbi:hypothetical protein EJ131_28570 [Bacillus mycoides]|uniref:hypothetical protein n=1 Tax=Bacillus mycoides TaxID=1405 RepID=UPI0022B5C3F4|nr:hypothetical protein [Bacillus mycoides]MCZ6944358.1 hypothetical protein [Bacillus mycoides]
MNDEKVVRIPISPKQRRMNEHGNGYVECEVSSRWLQFQEYNEDLGLVHVDVMTLGENNKERKLCELFIKRDELLKVLNFKK